MSICETVRDISGLICVTSNPHTRAEVKDVPSGDVFDCLTGDCLTHQLPGRSVSGSQTVCKDYVWCGLLKTH